MATNVVQFSREVFKSFEIPERELVALQKKVVRAYVEIVAQLTPFETGFAMAQWANVSIGAPNDAQIFTFPLSAVQVRNIASGRLRGLKFGQVVFVNNNAPYISFLNEGSSQQAPAMFVETAVASIEAAFR